VNGPLGARLKINARKNYRRRLLKIRLQGRSYFLPDLQLSPPFHFLYFLSLVLFLSLPFSALPFPSLTLPPCNQPSERCRLPLSTACPGRVRPLRLSMHFGGKTTGVFVLVYSRVGWLGSRVDSVLDSGAEGPGFKSQPRRCRVTVLGKLFTPVVLLFTKQRNW